MMLTGLVRSLTNRFDNRLNNVILKYGSLRPNGDPANRVFWSPGVFYPAQNTSLQ